MPLSQVSAEVGPLLEGVLVDACAAGVYVRPAADLTVGPFRWAPAQEVNVRGNTAKAPQPARGPSSLSGVLSLILVDDPQSRLGPLGVKMSHCHLVTRCDDHIWLREGVLAIHHRVIRLALSRSPPHLTLDRSLAKGRRSDAQNI